MTTAAAAQYSALRPFSHPGAYILLTALLTFVVSIGAAISASGPEQHGEPPARIVPELLQGAVPASIPIIAFLVMASIMKHSGQNLTLAMGIAAVAPAYVFAFLSNAIGILGAFMTSSSTSSQVIFSDVQMRLAQAKGPPVSPSWRPRARAGDRQCHRAGQRGDGREHGGDRRAGRRDPAQDAAVDRAGLRPVGRRRHRAACALFVQ